MVEGGPDGAPPVKRKRGRPRKADVLAAAAAAATADGGFSSPAAVNGVPAVPVPVPVGITTLKAEPKPRKPRKKKGEVSGALGVDTNLVGKTVTGVLDGSFDAGYLLTVRVGDSDTVLRGVVFGPGLTVPLSKTNDVAPGVLVVRRDENVPFPTPSPIFVLGATGVTPTTGFAAQTPSVPLVPSSAVPATAFSQVTPTTTPKAATLSAVATLPAVVSPDSVAK